MGWARLWLLAALAACGHDAAQPTDAAVDAASDAGIDPNDGAHSGSRLKLTWYEFTDGTRQYSGMYDAERKEYCSPYYPTWSDGNIYCTPDNGGDLVYSNSTCTQQILHVYQDTTCPQPPPTYYLDIAYGTCDDYHPTHLYLRGAKLTAATYYEKAGATCTAIAPESYDTFYHLGAELTPDNLVQLTLAAPAGANRLTTRYYTSPDGMQFPWTVYDNSIATDCTPSYETDDATTGTCAPDSTYAGYDRDVACEQPELGNPKTCATPEYAVVYGNDYCPTDIPHYYVVGDQVASTPLYEWDGTCTPSTADSTQNYFALTDQLAVAPLARTADTAEAHRIQLIHFTDPGGLRFRDQDELFDDQQGATCQPQTLPDGTIRCIVTGAFIDVYYKDSNCTMAVDLVEIYSGPASCGPPDIPKFAQKLTTPPPGTCTFGTEVHPISTAFAGTAYTGVPGSCSVYTPVQAKLYNVGATVPVTDFVSAVIVTDP